MTADEISRLKTLQDEGVLNSAEFAKAKAEILGRDTAAAPTPVKFDPLPPP